MKPVVKIILCSLVVLLLAGALVWAIGLDGTPVISLGDGNDKNYTVSDLSGELRLTEEIRGVDIDWSAGSIDIRSYEGSEIIVRETAQNDENDRLRYYVENGTLHIRERKSGLINIGLNKEKDLEILLPEGQYEWIELDVASAEMSLRDIQADRIDVDCASGDLEVYECDFNSLEFDSASGSFSMDASRAGEFEMDTASGSANLNGQVDSISFDSASGDLTVVSSVTPRQIEMDSASGRADITIPTDSQFTAELDSASGGLNVEGFSGNSRKDSYICGNGSAEYEFSTASGDVTIRAMNG